MDNTIFMITEYILIILAVFCFAGQFAFTKLYEGAVKQTAITTLVMLAVTGFFGAVMYIFVCNFSVSFSYVSLFWAAFMAVIMIPYYMIGIKVLSLGSLAIYSMFMMLGGMLVPFFYGVVFLHEELSVWQIVGTVTLTVFIILQAVWQQPTDENETQGSDKNKKILFFVLSILIFIINGMTGVIAKAHQISQGAVDEASFTVISCALTAIFSLMLLTFVALKNRREVLAQMKSMLKIKPIAVMLLIGASAYTGNFLHLKAASAVPASVQFPLVSGGVIVISALVSFFAFREKLSKKEWISVAGAFISTVLFAF